MILIGVFSTLTDTATHVTDALSSLAAGTHSAVPCAVFEPRAHLVVDHRHGDGLQ